jgi:hypothetical protein
VISFSGWNSRVREASSFPEPAADADDGGFSSADSPFRTRVMTDDFCDVDAEVQPRSGRRTGAKSFPPAWPGSSGAGDSPARPTSLSESLK